MDPITIGALINLVPSLFKFFGAGEKSTAIATEVANVAKSVTGASSMQDAVKVLEQDPAKLLEFRTAVLENDLEWERIYARDIADARARDVALAQAGQINYRANVLVAFAGFLVILLVAIAVWTSGIDEYVKGIITLILGRAVGWLDQAFNFDFGTTRNNRTKDDTINSLSKKD